MTCDRRRDENRDTVSRRNVLATAGLAVGTISLSGCLSRWEEDDPEPLDLDEDDLFAVAEIPVPEGPDLRAFDVAPEHIQSGRDRVESLLSPIPDDLTADVPNDAVRTLITESRRDARNSLEQVENASTAGGALSSLRQARWHAADAEGVYAVAVEGRTREDVFEEARAVRAELSTVESALSRTGEDPQWSVLVYAEIERRLDSAGRALAEGLDAIAPAASEVEAVSEAAERVEQARAQLEDAAHLDSRQPTDEAFDDLFRETAEAVLEDVESRVDELPDEIEDFLGAEVEHTPRAELGHLLRITRSDVERVRGFLDDGQLARALRRAYSLTHNLDTLDRLDERVADGGLTRPDSADELRAAKLDAIDEVESLQEETGHGALFENGIDSAVGTISGGDRYLEYVRERSFDIESSYGERYVLDALAAYATAAEQARAVPETTETVVDALETRRSG